VSFRLQLFACAGKTEMKVLNVLLLLLAWSSMAAAAGAAVAQPGQPAGAFCAQRTAGLGRRKTVYHHPYGFLMTPVCHDAGTPAADKLSAAGLDLVKRQQEPDLADTIVFDNPNAPNQACIDTVLLADVGGLSPNNEQVEVTVDPDTGTDDDTESSTEVVNDAVPASASLPDDLGSLKSGAFLAEGAVLVSQSLVDSGTSLTTMSAATITIEAEGLAGVVGYIITENTFVPQRLITVSLDAKL
jgi:hypothetical protein